MDQVKIGTFIAALRREKEWTQEELGAQVGVTNKTVSRWENGNYMPSIEILSLLSKEFGVSLNEMVQGQRLEDGDFRAAADENLTAVLERPMVRLRRWLDRNAGWMLAILLLCLSLVTAVILYYSYQRDHPVDVAPPGVFSYLETGSYLRQIHLSFYRDGTYSLFDTYGYCYQAGNYTQEGDLIQLDGEGPVRWVVIKGEGAYALHPEGNELLFYQWNGSIPFVMHSWAEEWLAYDPMPEHHPNWYN